MNMDFTFTIAKVLRKFPVKYISNSFNMYRHKKIQEDLSGIFEESYKSFKRYEKHDFRNVIWIFWWQGKNSMPEIVRKCYNSILRHSGDKNVILVTKDNVRNYTYISDIIYSKLKKGKITFTHFSDILRANILKNNGGLWMDATLYVTDSLDTIKLDKLYYQGGYYSDTFNISFGRWTGFLMGGPSGMDIMSFMDYLYHCYWEKNDELIDYFFIDYGLNYAWDKNLSNFKSLSNEYSNENPRLFDLQSLLNNEYDEKIWKKLNTETRIFKLSYKKNIDKENENNFYNHLR